MEREWKCVSRWCDRRLCAVTVNIVRVIEDCERVNGVRVNDVRADGVIEDMVSE